MLMIIWSPAFFIDKTLSQFCYVHASHDRFSTSLAWQPFSLALHLKLTIVYNVIWMCSTLMMHAKPFKRMASN